MFDIIHNFNVLFCFNQQINTINENISNGQQCVDSAVRPEDHGAPEHPHNVTVTEVHNDKMVVYVSTISHLWIVAEVILIPIKFLYHRLVTKRGQMGAILGKYCLNSENWTDMYEQVRS
jgi:hypothetical protein